MTHTESSISRRRRAVLRVRAMTAGLVTLAAVSVTGLAIHEADATAGTSSAVSTTAATVTTSPTPTATTTTSSTHHRKATHHKTTATENPSSASVQSTDQDPVATSGGSR